MVEEEIIIKLRELAMYARQKGLDDDYTIAVNNAIYIIDSYKRLLDNVNTNTNS